MTTPSSPAAPSPSTTEPAGVQTPSHSRGTARVWRLVALVAAATLAAHLAGFVTLPSRAPSTAPVAGPLDPAPLAEQATPTGEPAAAAVDNPVVAEQERALAHLRSVGSLDLWRPADPRVLGAGAGSTAILSGMVEGTCWYGAVDDGLTTTVAVDPTQEACTAVAIDTAVAALAAAAASTKADADARAASLLAVAVDGAKMWASTNYVDGMPSFAGLPGEVAPGVFTVNHSSVEVVLEARTGDGGCARAAVTAGGFVTELTCP